MSSVISDFLQLCATHGSDVVYHKDESVTLCPCLTPEGYRDPIWHLQNPLAPVCNSAGMLPSASTANFTVKGFIHPVQSGAVRRLTAEQFIALFGEVEMDDHLGILPCEWSGQLLNFYDWGAAAEDWVEYNGRKYNCVSANLIPDPLTGNPFHHWEVGLRLIES